MICNKCGKSFESGLARSVNVSRNPELKQQILDGTYFLSACPYCGQVNLDDGELTFAYPEKGQMQMLEIGQNVYADALGILSRNPELENKAGGLAKIDQEWLSRFFR